MSSVKSPHFCASGRLSEFNGHQRQYSSSSESNSSYADHGVLIDVCVEDHFKNAQFETIDSDTDKLPTIVQDACCGSELIPRRYDSRDMNSMPVESPGHRVIYCVHGKPEGCCATVISSSDGAIICGSSIPSPTIPLFENHCHRDRETTVDKRARKKLIIASILCLLFMMAEIIGGILSSSLAIATDAAHLLTDFASFMISLFALWVGSRPATRSMPFGWYRAEVMGALISVLMIWVVTGILFYVAVQRIISENYEIESEYMLITSVFGVCVNIVMACTLHQHTHHHHHHRHNDDEHSTNVENGHKSQHDQNINVRAAYIHVIGDFIQSFGVLVAAIVIYFRPEWKIVDPVCTFLFSILVLMTTFAILRDTIVVLMEGIPKGIDYSDVLNTFMSIDGVIKVHNLRIWALSLDKTALSAHLAVRPEVNTNTILKTASQRIHNKFNFFEMTLQIEEFQEQMDMCKQCQDPVI